MIKLIVFCSILYAFDLNLKFFRLNSTVFLIVQFLLLYGPFKICNTHTSECNYFCDNSLKMKNDLWGIKNLEEVCDESKKNGFSQEDIIGMPANNFSIIYRKFS